MVIKWTVEANKALVCAILTQMRNKIDYQAIADAWPVPEGSKKPTQRAIREQAGHIRDLLKTVPTSAQAAAIAAPSAKRVTKAKVNAAGPKAPGKEAGDKPKTNYKAPTVEAAVDEDLKGSNIDQEMGEEA